MFPKINESNFIKSVKQTIKEGRHVDYMQNVLKEYEEYKREFEKNLTEKNPEKEVYKFRAVYLLKKGTWREIELMGDDSFEELAEAVISSMGWDNDHLHGFELKKKNKKSSDLFGYRGLEFFSHYWEDDPHPTFKTDEIHIYSIDYAKQPKIGFIFDFGDGHRFSIEFKGTRKIQKKEKANRFPVVADKHGDAPEQYPAYKD